MSKYRLKVRKIPLTRDIPIYEIKFPPLDNLHLDLVENKEKLKKNPPKPVFYRAPEAEASKSEENYKHENNGYDSESDEILKELEKKYSADHSKSDDEEDDALLSTNEPENIENKEEIPDSSTKPAESNERPFYLEKEENSEDSEDREAQKKADLLFKFMVLRRQYPNVEIPEFSDHSDLGTMKKVYENVIRRVSLDSSVESYKKYLIGGFMVMEWVSVNWMGIDISGFTQQQMQAQNSYDRLLLELGEKNYTPLGSRFPVEVRLIFLVMFNAGLFYVQKSVFSGGGMNILSMLSGGGQTAPNNNQQRAAPPPKRKMRGPTISPEDIEKMSRNNEGSSDMSE